MDAINYGPEIMNFKNIFKLGNANIDKWCPSWVWKVIGMRVR